MITAGNETRFDGLSVSGGVAFSNACLFRQSLHSNLPVYRLRKENESRQEIPDEKARLDRALALAGERVQQLVDEAERRLGPAQAGIFVVQKMMLEDVELREQMYGRLEDGDLTAEAAVMMSLDTYEYALSQLDNSYLRERASDIGEVRRRLLDVLGNVHPELQCADDHRCQKGRNRIVVAEELTPSLTMELDAEFTLAFVTEHGGVGSHAAILARALGIPAVSGIKDIHKRISCGAEILVDGDRGRVVVWPSEKTLQKYPQLRKGVSPVLEAVAPVSGLKVMANISRSIEAESAWRVNAEGIGLYRTEFEFFAAGRALSEMEQAECYRRAASAMRGLPVYMRLLDLGGEKTPEFFKIPHEENPQLGLRGSRLLLARPDLFDVQVRALVRASDAGVVHLMYPMVIDVEQFYELRERFDRATKGMGGGTIRHGVMFETPSACLQGGDLLDAADFASIGTNDLTQYLFAVDRNNDLVAADYNPDRPVFWSIIRQLAQEARRRGKPLSVCGEMASDAKHLGKLMGEGIDTVSVSARLVASTRKCAALLSGGDAVKVGLDAAGLLS